MRVATRWFTSKSTTTNGSNQGHHVEHVPYSYMVVGCHLRHKVFEFAVSHETHNPKVGRLESSLRSELSGGNVVEIFRSHNPPHRIACLARGRMTSAAHGSPRGLGSR